MDTTLVAWSVPAVPILLVAFATQEGIAVATPDGILSYGHTDPLDMLTADLPVLDASLTTCTAAVESTADGWTVRLHHGA